MDTQVDLMETLLMCNIIHSAIELLYISSRKGRARPCFLQMPNAFLKSRSEGDFAFPIILLNNSKQFHAWGTIATVVLYAKCTYEFRWVTKAFGGMRWTRCLTLEFSPLSVCLFSSLWGCNNKVLLDAGV